MGLGSDRFECLACGWELPPIPPCEGCGAKGEPTVVHTSERRCADCRMMAQHGKKYDTSKPRMDLLPFDALEQVAAVLAFGAAKYGDNNWRLVEPVSRYEAAMLRHYAAHQRGEEIDPESEQSHLAHMATNALFILAKGKK